MQLVGVNEALGDFGDGSRCRYWQAERANQDELSWKASKSYQQTRQRPPKAGAASATSEIQALLFVNGAHEMQIARSRELQDYGRTQLDEYPVWMVPGQAAAEQLPKELQMSQSATSTVSQSMSSAPQPQWQRPSA
jgi:hypothetical protein